MHSILEHGRQLAAEEDQAASDLAAGGGSLAGSQRGSRVRLGAGTEAARAEEGEGEGTTPPPDEVPCSPPASPCSPRLAGATWKEVAAAASEDVAGGALLTASIEEEPALPMEAFAGPEEGPEAGHQEPAAAQPREAVVPGEEGPEAPAPALSQEEEAARATAEGPEAHAPVLTVAPRGCQQTMKVRWEEGCSGGVGPACKEGR